jgi:hypothetical protein
MKTMRLLLSLAVLLCTTSAGGQSSTSQVLVSKANEVISNVASCVTAVMSALPTQARGQ